MSFAGEEIIRAVFEHEFARRLILGVARVQAHRAAVQIEFLEELAGDGDSGRCARGSQAGP